MKRIFWLVVMLLVMSAFCSAEPLFAERDNSSREGAAAVSTKNADAIDRYWQTLVKYPKRGPVFDRVWKAYSDKGEVAALVARCRRLVVESPEDASCRLLEGLVFAQRGLSAEALESWRQARRLSPGDVRASLYRGELLLSEGQLELAARDLEEATRCSAGSMEQGQAFLSLGRVYVRLGKTAKATEVWRRFEKSFPDDLEVKLRVAELLVEEGKLAEALDRYEELIRLCREDDELRLRYMYEATGLMVQLGQRPNAMTTLKTISDALTAEHWLAGPVRKRLEQLYRQSGDLAGLARYEESRLATQPREIETIQSLTQTYIQLGHTDKAQKLLEKSLDETESSIASRLVLIDLLASKGNLTAVEKQCNEVLRFASNDPTTVERLGLALLRCERTSGAIAREKAVQCWELLLSGKQNDVRRLDRLAKLLTAQGFNDEAMKYFRRAVELEPDSPSLCMALADEWVKREQYQKALELYSRICRQSTDRGSSWKTTAQTKLVSLYEATSGESNLDPSVLATILRDMPPDKLLTLCDREMSLGKYELARRVLESIPRGEVQFWEVLYRQGVLAACLGNRNESRACFGRLRQLKEQDNKPGILRDPAAVLEAARRVLALSLRIDKKSIRVSECFQGVILGEGLVLFATVFSDRISGRHPDHSSQVCYQPGNYHTAVLASRVWELKLIWETDRNAFDRAVSKLREDYAVDWKEPDRKLLYERLKRRCLFECVMCGWLRLDKRNATEVKEQIETARRMMLSLGFVSDRLDRTILDWRDQCGRILIKSLAFEELDAFWKTFDLDGAIEKYYASPAPNLDIETLRPKQVEASDGMPSSLDGKLRWIITWLEWDVLRTASHRDRLQSIYQRVSREIYEEAGQVMDLLAPVCSLDFSMGDYVIIRKAVDKRNDVALTERFDKISQKIFASFPDFNLNGAFAAITRSGLVLNASGNSLLQFNPCIAFPKDYKGLADSLSCLDRFLACREKSGNASALDTASLDALFFVYLLHAGDLLFEWTGLPRERYSWEKLIQPRQTSREKPASSPPPRKVAKSQLLELQRSLREVDMLVDLYLRYWNRLTALRLKTQAGQTQKSTNSPNVWGGRFLLTVDLLASRLDVILGESLPGQGVTRVSLDCHVQRKLRERIIESVQNGEYAELRSLLPECFKVPTKDSTRERKNI